LVPSLIEIGLLVLEKNIFFKNQSIFILSLLSPLGKGVTLHMNNSESPLPKNSLCQLWLQLAQRFWRKS
jgi:hypothetical protein